MNIGWFSNTWNPLNFMLSKVASITFLIDPTFPFKNTGMRFYLSPTAYTVQQAVFTYDELIILTTIGSIYTTARGIYSLINLFLTRDEDEV